MYHSSSRLGWSDCAIALARARAIVHVREAALADSDLLQSARKAVTAKNRCCYIAVGNSGATESQKP